jgi:prenyltransferase beta subunit
MIGLPGLVAVGLTSLALLGAGAAPAQASTTSRAKAYLLGVQNADGGFGSARGEKSGPSLTGWAALGLAAAGHSPRQKSARGASTIDYLRSRPQPRAAGALARTLLVLRAAGLPARFAGRDIHGHLMRHWRPDGSFGGLVNLTAFGILATSASSDPRQVLRNQQSATWLTQQQNPDGGFSYFPGGTSGVDDTAAAVQALVAAGMGESPPAGAAVEFLLAAQQVGGGFASAHTHSPAAANSMSTSWAIQALIAAGLDPAQVLENGRTPIDYLRSLQNPDGSIRYSRRINHNPVWATAQALPALAGHAFPLDPVPVDTKPAPEHQSPAPPQEATQPSAAVEDARPQQATAQPPSTHRLYGGTPDGAIADRRLSQRVRADGTPDSRLPFSPPERISDRSQRGSDSELGEARAGSSGWKPVEVAILALALSTLSGLAGWWGHGRRDGGALTEAGDKSKPPSSGEPASEPPDDLDRELATLLAGQPAQETSEPQPDRERNRTLEPH